MMRENKSEIVWEADFYRGPEINDRGEAIWELTICDRDNNFTYKAKCDLSQAGVNWLVEQLQKAGQKQLPNTLKVFRPQCLGLFELAGEQLNIITEPTRRTAKLKQELQARAINYVNYDPLKLDKLPPQAIPDNLWGEEWRFASLPAGDLIEIFCDRPIPILDLPEVLFPLNLGIASNTPIPGTIVYGGRQSLRLARWLGEVRPVALNYIPTVAGESGGLILEAGLIDRWIFATFEDEEVAISAQNYESRKLKSNGLHFLLIQPDDSGMTQSGFWLLREE
jgi:hypothetical protein